MKCNLNALKRAESYHDYVGYSNGTYGITNYFYRLTTVPMPKHSGIECVISTTISKEDPELLMDVLIDGRSISYEDVLMSEEQDTIARNIKHAVKRQLKELYVCGAVA